MYYQKITEDDKKPDFILEINSNSGNTINLVLDSKFKNYNYKKSIIYETVEMHKKYGSVDNYVFILHPCNDGVFNSKKNRYTNYGGERIFDNGEKKFPFHQYGYIEIKPNLPDNLKKLIAMAFEYLLESSKNAMINNQIDPKPKNDLFCISCGGTDISIDKNVRSPNKYFYTCICNDQYCGHEIRIDYCWKCRTKLYKHGSSWDYHLESLWSTYDIRCPQCGMTVQDMPKSNYL